MLRTGLYLLSTSSLGVIYRILELPFAVLPLLKYGCMVGLIVALGCFALTYARTFTPTDNGILTRRIHMLKFTAWKFSVSE